MHTEVPSTNGLAPHSPQVLNADGEPIWKVLVFDNLGRDVISSVLRVNGLAQLGRHNTSVSSSMTGLPEDTIWS